MNKLREFYTDSGPERVGFILTDETVVEVKNNHPNPELGFDISAEDLIKFEDSVTATWHTHPNTNANLSVHDEGAFWMYPDLVHYIIGNDGIRSYRFDGPRLMQQHET